MISYEEVAIHPNYLDIGLCFQRTGSGAPNPPQVEAEFISWSHDQCQRKLSMSYQLLRQVAQIIGDNHNVSLADFKCCIRNFFSSRHIA